ncbi:unnamed protein product, partial [Iphiclides podalirius]
MKTLDILVLAVAFGDVLCDQVAQTNSSAAKDMYVVHATVYQVGILTNKTDDEIGKAQGNQESITFFHRNGSAVDLSGIHNPLLTNVTAQSIVGVAPIQDVNHTNDLVPWTALEKLASVQQQKAPADPTRSDANQAMKFKREVASVPVKLVKGAAVVPPGTGVQSLALPPLLTLNSNLSLIPVPIPNTSVVRYAKINTLVKSPQHF